ncbi:hypothetical protein [Halobacillus seohaensis]|uniref:RNA polymerase sigma-70 region 2 domain-containing protein n=1 Tax=Halobacillus seohaensis TaxID=447421 RepID=A0ABW2EFG6_9BACI
MKIDQQEQKLIQKVKKGNQRAFKKLYEAYSDYALRSFMNNVQLFQRFFKCIISI